MILQDLLTVLPEYHATGSPDARIAGISHDSRSVRKDYLFVALPGWKRHGLQFLEEALQNGAAAILSDREATTKLPSVVVRNPRLALSLLSTKFYSYPSNKLKLTGVTGTNGKTTTTFLLRAILEEAGTKCGLIGTIRYSGESFTEDAAKTTPESPRLQELLARMVEERMGACVLEVSSQGLTQYRVAGCNFHTAVFTNLTHEHLDYHRTMDQYFEAKMMLFDGQTCTVGMAVANIDDPYGAKLIDVRHHMGLPAAGFGFSPLADFQIRDAVVAKTGSEFTIQHEGARVRIRTPLVGKYNLYNIAGAFAVAHLNGLETEIIQRGIEKAPSVPGRMQELHFGQPFLVFIDYAHTDDAFRQLLPTLRLYTKNRLIHIFGCRGARDRLKRPKMGLASGELADIVFLTSDNPRDEDPEQIMSEVRKGLDASGNANIFPVVDRAEAISRAVAEAQPGDTIVITGKGNETYQYIGDTKFSFDEAELFRAAIQNNK